MTTTEVRRIGHGRKEFIHRTKNGVYDPITYFHVLDGLMDIVPGHTFQTREFVEYLTHSRPQLVWDPTTVGRVINDIGETLAETNASRAISMKRSWDGMRYSIDDSPETRAALVHLRKDLYDLSAELIEAEKAGTPPKRLNSPLLQCPSVAQVG